MTREDEKREGIECLTRAQVVALRVLISNNPTGRLMCPHSESARVYGSTLRALCRRGILVYGWTDDDGQPVAAMGLYTGPRARYTLTELGASLAAQVPL